MKKRKITVLVLALSLIAKNYALIFTIPLGNRIRELLHDVSTQ